MTETKTSLSRRQLFSCRPIQALTLSSLVLTSPLVFAQALVQTQTQENANAANQQILQKWQTKPPRNQYTTIITLQTRGKVIYSLKTGTSKTVLFNTSNSYTPRRAPVQTLRLAVIQHCQYVQMVKSVLSFGDVVAAFSGLGSNLGLRGTLGTKELGALTLTGFAGVVAESWEALNNRSALDGLAPRTRYIRDVLGAKAEYKISDTLTGFMTLQNYHDRLGSVELPAGSVALDGRITTVGSKYVNGNLQVSAEIAHSSKNDLVAQIDRSGNAGISMHYR